MAVLTAQKSNTYSPFRLMLLDRTTISKAICDDSNNPAKPCHFALTGSGVFCCAGHREPPRLMPRNGHWCVAATATAHVLRVNNRLQSMINTERMRVGLCLAPIAHLIAFCNIQMAIVSKWKSVRVFAMQSRHIGIASLHSHASAGRARCI